MQHTRRTAFAALFGREVGRVEPRVGERLACGGERERDGARDVPTVFRLQLALPVETAHLGGDPDGRVRRVETLDAPDAARAALQGLPDSLAPDADRGHAPHPRDHHSTRLPQTSQHMNSLAR